MDLDRLPQDLIEYLFQFLNDKVYFLLRSTNSNWSQVVFTILSSLSLSTYQADRVDPSHLSHLKALRIYYKRSRGAECHWRVQYPHVSYPRSRYRVLTTPNSLANLERLSIADRQLKMAHLLRLPSLRSLTDLRLHSYTHSRNKDRLPDLLCRLTALRVLHVSTLRRVEYHGLTGLSNLEALALPQVDSLDDIHLLLTCMPKLTTLCFESRFVVEAHLKTQLPDANPEALRQLFPRTMNLQPGCSFVYECCRASLSYLPQLLVAGFDLNGGVGPFSGAIFQRLSPILTAINEENEPIFTALLKAGVSLNGRSPSRQIRVTPRNEPLIVHALGRGMHPSTLCGRIGYDRLIAQAVESNCLRLLTVLCRDFAVPLDSLAETMNKWVPTVSVEMFRLLLDFGYDPRLRLSGECWVSKTFQMQQPSLCHVVAALRPDFFDELTLRIKIDLKEDYAFTVGQRFTVMHCSAVIGNFEAVLGYASEYFGLDRAGFADFINTPSAAGIYPISFYIQCRDLSNLELLVMCGADISSDKVRVDMLNACCASAHAFQSQNRFPDLLRDSFDREYLKRTKPDTVSRAIQSEMSTTFIERLVALGFPISGIHRARPTHLPYLLEHGADVHEVVPPGVPLVFCFWRADPATLEMLRKAGIDFNLIHNNRSFIWHYIDHFSVMGSLGDLEEALKVILRGTSQATLNFASLDLLSPFAKLAATLGRKECYAYHIGEKLYQETYEALDCLVSAGADPKQTFDFSAVSRSEKTQTTRWVIQPRDKNTILHLWRGASPSVPRYLVEKFKLDLEAQNDLGETPLAMNACLGNFDESLALLRTGADAKCRVICYIRPADFDATVAAPLPAGFLSGRGAKPSPEFLGDHTQPISISLAEYLLRKVCACKLRRHLNHRRFFLLITILRACGSDNLLAELKNPAHAGTLAAPLRTPDKPQSRPELVKAHLPGISVKFISNIIGILSQVTAIIEMKGRTTQGDHCFFGSSRHVQHPAQKDFENPRIFWKMQPTYQYTVSWIHWIVGCLLDAKLVADARRPAEVQVIAPSSLIGQTLAGRGSLLKYLTEKGIYESLKQHLQ